MEVKRRVLGQEHPETLSTINNLAGLYRDQGKYVLAEPLLTNLLEVRRRVLGPEHPDTLISMNNLGLLYVYESRYAEAEPLLTQTLELRQRVLGGEHADTLVSMNNLAQLYVYERKYATAEPIYLKVVELNQRVLPSEHPRRLTTMNELTGLYVKTGKYVAAEALLREALNSHDESSPTTWVHYSCQSLLGSSLAGQGKYAEAESLLLSGYQGMLRLRTTIPWERRLALNDGAEWISQLYESWGKPEKAAEWRQKAQMKSADHLQH
jgi:tetratricopeptide (TPR) repeat protein